jgi:membrane associated rhomboid family serine protease
MINFNLSPMVKNLLILNVVIYLGMAFLARDLAPFLFDTFALWFVDNPNFQVWQPITHMFMHSLDGYTHILYNMLFLVFLGPAIENWMGSKRFLFFYLMCGIGAFLTVTAVDYYSFLFDTDAFMRDGYYRPSVGASGAVYGVMAAFLWLFPNRTIVLFPIPIPVKVKYLIGFYMIKELLATLGIIGTSANVAHLAHIGGALFGFIMIWYWKRNDMDKYRIY